MNYVTTLVERRPPAEDKRKYKGAQFINIKSSRWGIETIDEFATLKEAQAMLKEYRLVYQNTGIPVWISQRPDNTWYGDDDDGSTTK